MSRQYILTSVHNVGSPGNSKGDREAQAHRPPHAQTQNRRSVKQTKAHQK